jgi:hypothetical protein
VWHLPSSLRGCLAACKGGALEVAGAACKPRCRVAPGTIPTTTMKKWAVALAAGLLLAVGLVVGLVRTPPPLRAAGQQHSCRDWPAAAPAAAARAAEGCAGGGRATARGIQRDAAGEGCAGAQRGGSQLVPPSSPGARRPPERHQQAAADPAAHRSRRTMGV